MAFNSKHLTQLLGSLRGAGVIRKHDPHPVRDWLMLLGMGSALLCGLLGYGVIIYQLDRLAPDHAMQVGTELTLNRSELDRMVAHYRERAVRFETLRHAAPGSPDPGDRNESNETTEAGAPEL